jgi:energy-coupling factor transporter ATP-binding protein EcfA2
MKYYLIVINFIYIEYEIKILKRYINLIMKIYMENFKCFEKATINFDEEKFILITGPSGFGKSSIFESIFFALWGNRSFDIISFNKKKCKVELYWKNLKIVRTKNPNNFIIQKLNNLEFIKNPEEYIERYVKEYSFGFISMKEDIQRKIIDRIINQTQVESINTNLKRIIKEGYSYLKETEINLNSIEKVLESLPEIKNIQKPEKLQKNSIQDLQEKLHNIDKSINEKRLKMSIYEENVKIYNNIQVNIEDFNIINEKIQDLEKLYKKVIENKTIEENIKDIELKISKLSLEPISFDLELYSEKIRKNNSLIKEIKFLWEQCKFKKETNDILKIKKWIEEYPEKDEYSCPNCKTQLILLDNNLIITNSGYLKKILQQKEEIDENFSEEEFNILKRKYEKNKKISRDLAIQKENLKHFREKLTFYDRTFEEILEEINELKSIANKINRKKEIQKVLQNSDDIDDIIIDKLIKKKEKICKDIELGKNFNNTIELWEMNEKMSSIKIYNENQSKKFKLDIINIRERIKDLETIKDITNESYLKSLKNFINDFNRYVDHLIGKFFKNGEFSINIDIIKDTKNKTKFSLDIQVFSDGVSRKIQGLSSGEFARLSLAIDVALYKLSGTCVPLLLDEPTSNLDSCSSVDILETLNEFVDNQILVIAHQVTEGIFDKIYNHEFISEYSKFI